MIEWQDDGLILSARPQGENNILLSVMSEQHGRVLGILNGGQSRTKAAIIQPGNAVRCAWRTRLSEQLGHFTSLETAYPWPAMIMSQSERLLAMTAALSVVEQAMAEQQPYPATFHGLSALLESLSHSEHWPYSYVRWEIGLLRDLGYGVDLSTCAVSGATTGLTHVSPKSARAVCAEAAAPYLEKLLKLPAFLTANESPDSDPTQAIVEGLALTGYFLSTHVFSQKKGILPPSRTRLAHHFIDQAQKSAFC